MSTRDGYPSYRLTARARTRPADLDRVLGLYNVPGTMYLREETEDGVPCTVHIAPVGMATYGAIGRIFGFVLTLLAAVVSLALTVWAAWKVGVYVDCDAPAVVVMDVHLIVSPMRASWAELLLVKWAVRNGWSIEPAEGHNWQDDQNLARARKDNSYPYPWKQAKGYSTARSI